MDCGLGHFVLEDELCQAEDSSRNGNYRRVQSDAWPVTVRLGLPLIGQGSRLGQRERALAGRRLLASGPGHGAYSRRLGSLDLMVICCSEYRFWPSQSSDVALCRCSVHEFSLGLWSAGFAWACGAEGRTGLTDRLGDLVDR